MALSAPSLIFNLGLFNLPTLISAAAAAASQTFMKFINLFLSVQSKQTINLNTGGFTLVASWYQRLVKAISALFSSLRGHWLRIKTALWGSIPINTLNNDLPKPPAAPAAPVETGTPSTPEATSDTESPTGSGEVTPTPHNRAL